MGAFSVSLLFLGWTEHFGDGEIPVLMKKSCRVWIREAEGQQLYCRSCSSSHSNS